MAEDANATALQRAGIPIVFCLGIAPHFCVFEQLYGIGKNSWEKEYLSSRKSTAPPQVATLAYSCGIIGL